MKLLLAATESRAGASVPSPAVRQLPPRTPCVLARLVSGRPLLEMNRIPRVTRQRLSLVVLTTAILLFVAQGLLADQGSAFTARVSVANSYFDEQGKVLEHYDTVCDVFVGKGTFFIKPTPVNCPSNVVLGAVAVSPYSPSNFVSGYSVPFNSSLFSEVIVGRSPSQCDIGFAGHLLKLAYVPATDYSKVVSSNAFFFIPGETGSYYEPSDIVFSVQYLADERCALPSAVKAYSPDYYYVRPGKRQTFRGPARNRLLWEYKVTLWTNALGSHFPVTFQYIRYNDAERRTVADHKVPIIVCQGNMESLTPGIRDRFEEHLGQTLVVTDVRRTQDTFGRPLIYTVTNGMWLDEQSPAFAGLVSALRRSVERERSASTVASANPTALFCVFALILLMPFVVLVKQRSNSPKQ